MKQLFVFLMCVSMMGYVHANDDRVVSTSAVGEIESLPDIVLVSGRVSVIEKNAERAISKAQQSLDSVIKFIESQKIPAKDLQAASIMVQPQWYYSRNQPREITGYQAYAPFKLRLQQIEKLSSLYSGLPDAGANELNKIEFDFSDRQALELKAIEKAVKLAKQKAHVAASALDQSIGKALRIRIDTRWNQPVMPQMRMAMKAEADAAPPRVNVGNHKLSATVNVDFELK
jgi:uncharacterized protein YggE